MKIGIDAIWLFKGPISGKLFIQNVLPELFRLHPEVEWHLFLNKDDKYISLPFENKKIKTHYVWAKIKMLSDLFMIPKLARKLKLDAVLFQTFSPKGKSFSSIVFIHDILFKNFPQYFTWKERLYFLPLRWTIRKADKVITTTEFVKKELQHFHYVRNNQPIDLSPSGVTNIFHPIELHDKLYLKNVKEKFTLPDIYLLFVGRLNARKNIETLFKALPMIEKKIPLVIVGERDWKQPKLNHLLKNEKIYSKVKFCGSIPDEDLPAIYAMATVFCYPSFAEGFGLPPLEAMASGIPVLVSNVTAMPEVCGNAAVFINPHDPKDIAENVNKLLSNDSLYSQKVAEGLKWSQQYRWEKTAERILESIFTTIGRK